LRVHIRKHEYDKDTGQLWRAYEWIATNLGKRCFSRWIASIIGLGTCLRAAKFQGIGSISTSNRSMEFTFAIFLCLWDARTSNAPLRKFGVTSQQTYTRRKPAVCTQGGPIQSFSSSTRVVSAWIWRDSNVWCCCQRQLFSDVFSMRSRVVKDGQR